MFANTQAMPIRKSWADEMEEELWDAASTSLESCTSQDEQASDCSEEEASQKACKDQLKSLLELLVFKNLKQEVEVLDAILELPPSLCSALINARETFKKQTKKNGKDVEEELQRIDVDKLPEKLLDQFADTLLKLSKDKSSQKQFQTLIGKDRKLCSICGQALAQADVEVAQAVLSAILSHQTDNPHESGVMGFFTKENHNNLTQALIKNNVLPAHDQERLVSSLLEELESKGQQQTLELEKWIQQKLKKLATDKYASRVIEHLAKSSRRLCKELLDLPEKDFLDVACDRIGNYVLQGMLNHDEGRSEGDSIRNQVLRKLGRNGLHQIESFAAGKDHKWLRELAKKLHNLTKDESPESPQIRDESESQCARYDWQDWYDMVDVDANYVGVPDVYSLQRWSYSGHVLDNGYVLQRCC